MCSVPAVISDASCVFPFSYGSSVHYSCTFIHSDYAWCSLNSSFQGKWRYCTAQDPPECVFPFTFKKKTFYNCTKTGYVLGRSWCSLSHNYNQEKKWKQCSPHHGTKSARAVDNGHALLQYLDNPGGFEESEVEDSSAASPDTVLPPDSMG
ncbi:binder of sperm protein homolog 2-like [Thomomys bottae]